MSNKAQGLPMNTLVIGALSLLVLIAVATMWVSGGGNIFQGFSQIIGGSTPSTLSQARISCQASCQDLQNAQASYTWSATVGDRDDVFSSYKYCKLTFNIEETGNTDARCYDADGSGTGITALEECVISGEVLSETVGC